MNKSTFSKEPDPKDSEALFHGLAIHASDERICTDAQPVLDPESIERFCQVWGEVGRAILARRSKSNE